MVDTVRKIADVLATILQDGQADLSITPQDVRDAFLSMCPSANNGFGFYLDGQYTLGSPLALTGGVRTKITNNGALETKMSDMAGLGFAAGPGITLQFDPWNTTTSKIVPIYADSSCMVQLALSANTANPNNFVSVEVDVGGVTGAFLSQTQLFAKGTGVETDFVFNWNLFSGPDFLTNGAELFITADSNANLYGAALTITRMGRPFI